MEPTPLEGIRDQQAAAAGEMDQLGDASFQLLAAQWKAISPDASGMVLAALAPVLTLMGGAIDGAPTTIADPAVARALSAISDAVQDAVDEDVLPAELAYEPGDITDDQSAALVAGKLSKIATDKGFAKFLKQPAKPPTAPAKPPPKDTPPDKAAEDDFFAKRMK